MPFQRDIATVRENMVQRESTPGALGNEIDGDEELAIFFSIIQFLSTVS